jgi:hypothetical protein
MSPPRIVTAKVRGIQDAAAAQAAYERAKAALVAAGMPKGTEPTLEMLEAYLRARPGPKPLNRADVAKARGTLIARWRAAAPNEPPREPKNKELAAEIGCHPRTVARAKERPAY